MFTYTMAEANGIHDLPMEQVQSILEGYSDNDSQRSLPQVPDTTIDGTDLSSVRQNLSSSFNRLRRGIASCMGRNTNQPQAHVEMEVDAEQLSPNSLHTQLAACQTTVKGLHEQNECNAELLGCLEAIITEKDTEISHLRIKDTEKDLRLEAQQRDFQAQLTVEQTARQQVSNTLEGLQQELEEIRAQQNNHNPMDVSSTTDANNKLNREKEKAEEKKRLLAEKQAKTKAEYEQALKDKNREINSEIERIKKNMEEQMHKEWEQAVKANEHQLKTIMSELRTLKEKQEEEFTKRKAGEQVLLDNIKASIDPILKSDQKSSDHIGIGAWLKNLQDEVHNYLPPTVNKKHGGAVTTDDTFGDWTLGGTCTDRHVHFASTPVKPEVSNIQLTTPPCAAKEEVLAESLVQNTMQTLASEFK